jgi:hypothetical protein
MDKKNIKALKAYVKVIEKIDFAKETKNLKKAVKGLQKTFKRFRSENGRTRI